MKRAIVVAGAIFVSCSALIDAQWPKFQDSGVPRDEKGRVRMDAAPPKTADGKPDLSGNWTRSDRDPLPAELKGIVRDRDLVRQPGQDPPAEGIFVGSGTASSRPDPKSPPVATFFELGANFPDGLPFTPWAANLKKERMAANAKDNPDANCLPMGIPQFHMQPQPRKIIQTPKLIVILYESNYGLRYIYMDGRTLPPQGEPQPWWYGYSIGRWDGDTLVVESNNFTGAESSQYDGWLDVRGSPYSSQAKFIERFRRPTFGRLEIDVTLEDSKAYTKPFTVRINQRVIVDEEPIEFICNENQQFRVRVKVD
jgi:hypothetical protein